MSIELNHTIVGATDKHASARFLADILGRTVGADDGPFTPVRLDNGVTLDYMQRVQVTPQHYAFLVSDEEFDAGFARIREAGLAYFCRSRIPAAGPDQHPLGRPGLLLSRP
jgi:hypothetical protein